MIRLISQFLQQWKLCSPLNGIINSKLCPVKKAIEAILGAFRLVWPHAAQYCHVMDSLFEWSSCFFWSRDSFIRYVLLILPNAMDIECLSGHTPQFFTFWIVVVNTVIRFRNPYSVAEAAIQIWVWAFQFQFIRSLFL